MSLPGDSYWVEEGRFLAGPYPGDPDLGREREKLTEFLELGMKRFVDLTQPGEHSPYAPMLQRIAAELDRGNPVYLHCRGGAGRTGTVVGCFLIERGEPPAQALSDIAADRRDLHSKRRAWSSPETEEQRQFVLGWRSGRS